MQLRKLGPFDVSAIGLGCMNCSMGYGPADDEESGRLLNEALDLGYRLLDTAAMYGHGHNERLIGEAVSHRRAEYVLASKCGIGKDASGKTVANGRPEVLRRQCENSLRNLRTEVIDLYYLHRIDPQVPVEESVGLLGDLVAEGKILTIGLSEISTASLRRAHGEHPVTAVQSEYSLWSRTPEAGILNACTELGVAFVPFSPLGRGFLTGKATDVNALPDDDLRCTIARPRFEPDNFAHNAKLLQPFKRIAERLGCTPGQLALAWLLARVDAAGERTLIPIPGTKHREYLRENAGAAEVELDDATVSELDELINEQTVSGSRYTDELMASVDSERDRA